MVKGFYLKVPPYMLDYESEVDILAELDVLMEKDEDSNVRPDGVLTTRHYEGENLHIVVLNFHNSPSALDSMMAVVSLLQAAGPDLFRGFKYGEDQVIIAYPVLMVSYNDKERPKNLYKVLIEELLRVTTFILTRDISPLDRLMYLKDYINTFINW